MPLNQFTSPLYIVSKPSLQKMLLIAIPHLLVLIMVASLDVFAMELKLGLIFVILLSTYYYLRLYYFQTSNKSVIELKQDSAKNWMISTINTMKAQESFSVDLLPTSFISKWLIILNFVDNNRSHYKVIFTPDSLSANEFRHLYTRIKLTNIKKS
jgi:hypothetical protein